MMKIKKIRFQPWFFIGCLVALWAITGCGSNERKDIPDVSDIKVALKIQRFEQDLFNLDTTNTEASLRALNTKYGYFANLYFSEIMRFKPFQDTSYQYAAGIPSFIAYAPLRKLYDTCQVVYGDFTDLEADFTNAFQLYKYYFPKKAIPQITTFISEYGVGVASVGEGEIIIGLDMFLGANYQPYYYPQVQLPQYVTRTLTKAHIVPKAMEALSREIVGVEEGSRLIDKMIQNGKVLYLLDLLQPQVADSIRLGITDAQVQWLKNNEGEMWKTVFINNLYETKLKKAGLLGLIEVAPTSPGMPKESPGNAGSWVGWQIIKSYMMNNPNITLEQLLQPQDAQKILQASRYKPRS